MSAAILFITCVLLVYILSAGVLLRIVDPADSYHENNTWLYMNSIGMAGGLVPQSTIPGKT
jgi:hypothetical protein